MRSFLRDAFVRRFIGGFALGIVAMATWQGGALAVAHAETSSPVSETISAR